MPGLTQAKPRRNRTRRMLRYVNALALAGGLSAMPVFAQAATMQVLYPFAASGATGCYPDGTLLRDAAGALYGATYSCGVNNSGTVFRLNPPQPGQTRWTASVLYSFLDPDHDGWLPNPGLIKDGSGALYGTTTYGGSDLQGVAYKLTPPAAGGTRWTETVLHAFHYNYATGDGDGSHPGGGLIRDRAGALYGTTMLGGDPGSSGTGYGTVFKLTPPRPGETAWSETVLYRFAGGADGWSPLAVLTADAAGALYGTTLYGGVGQCQDNWGFVAGCGTVFKLTPPVPPRTAWTKTTLYRFRGGIDGGQPHGRLLLRAGALYGTTFMGGRSRCEDGTPSAVVGCGTAFRLAPPASGQGAWVKSVLYDFMGADGAFPQGGLIVGAGGALYGTASSGGAGYGVAFKLTPPAAGNTKWKQTVLARLNVLTSGYTPVGELAADPAGRLLGVAFWGGPNLYGSVFAVTP